MSISQRNQSIEFLRIILMTLIVFGHILLFGFSDSYDNALPCALLQPLYLFHVDAFVFISGYFGIKLNGGGKFLNLVLKMFIYSIIACGAYFCLVSQFSIVTLLKNIYPVSACDWWFMAQYLFLMLMTPFLNAGMEKLNRRQSTILIAVMYIMSFRIFSCLLVFIYILGRYMRKFPSVLIEKYAGKIFLVAIVAFFVFNLVCMHKGWHPKKMYEYYSPFNVVAAVAIFYVFKNMRIKWNGFGYVSTGVLAAYLITTHELMQVPFNKWIVSIMGDNVLMLLFAALGIVLFCSMIDKCISPLIVGVQNRILGNKKTWTER